MFFRLNLNLGWIQTTIQTSPKLNVFIIFIMHIIPYNNIYFLFKFLRKNLLNYNISYVFFHYFRNKYKFIFTCFVVILIFFLFPI